MPPTRTPELLSLTHEELSMQWAAPPFFDGVDLKDRMYVAELAEEDGVVDDDEEWTKIYEGWQAGCVIST